MLIRLGYDIQFQVYEPMPLLAMLCVHPSRRDALRTPDSVTVEPWSPTEEYQDAQGNLCTRLFAQPGPLRLINDTLVEDAGLPDAVDWNAREVPIAQLPTSVLRYLLASRYCEVDLLSHVANHLFGHTGRGWARVQSICDWVHTNVAFSYPHASPIRTAMDTFNQRIGVCRDFQHLAITFCRAMNIPARYATGYLGDIGVVPSPAPMDFSAWFEVYLEGRWWTFDARHNRPRIGRVLVATGIDAIDVAITTSFGNPLLSSFRVVTYEERAV